MKKVEPFSYMADRVFADIQSDAAATKAAVKSKRIFMTAKV